MQERKFPRLETIDGSRSKDDRQPPCNIDLEEEILGGILVDPGAIERVSSLAPEAFYMKAHQLVWSTALEFHASGRPVDLMSLAVALSERGVLDRVGGQSRLAELFGRTIGAVNIDHYAELLESLWQRRKLLAIAAEITEMAFDTTNPVSKAIDSTTEKLFEVSRQGRKRTSVQIGETMNQYFAELEERASGQRRLGIACGFYDLDAMTGGFQPGDLIIPAGRPAMGKTSWALQVAYQMASYHKLPTVFFSLEMKTGQLIDRLVSLDAQIETGRLRSGRVLDREWDLLGHTFHRLSDAPLYLDEEAFTIERMRAACFQVAAENGGKMGGIFVDYLQLMVEGDDPVRELDRATKELKRLGKKLDCPVFALSQLNRGLESRTNKRPMMSDLRDSGGIEQNADLIISLYRDEYYNPDTPDRGLAEVSIIKHRNGPVGTVKLLFEPQFTRFRNLVAPGRDR